MIADLVCASVITACLYGAVRFYALWRATAPAPAKPDRQLTSAFNWDSITHS